MKLLVDAEAADHLRWIARSWEGVLERWLDGYAIDVRGREGRVRATFEAPTDRVWLLVDANEPVAMAVARVVPHRYATSTVVELQALWSAPKRRREGHARRLLEAVRTWGRERGADGLEADVDTRDEASRRLLQGAGWSPRAVRVGVDL